MDSPSIPNPEQPVTPVLPDGQVPTPAPMGAAEGPRSPEQGDAPETPLTPGQWLAQNGIYLAILVGGLIWLYRSHGWEGLPSAFLTVFGIGFIIFIHELGHFLVAKWCDVHVLTFSIGFGPAIPGCSFRRGETTYKLALLPLGGYVNMVGEGADADEGEDYPRSFKNKSVGQRMAIISAGVIMNVILGAIAFTFVYRVHGVERLRAAVGRVDPGGVAWTDGVRSGWRIDQIGSNTKPNFDDLRIQVMLSQKNAELPFQFFDPYAKNTKDREKYIDLKPLRGDGMSPVIGVSGPSRLELVGPEYKKVYTSPAGRNSAAAAARVLELKPGDAIVSTSDPDNPSEMKSLTPVDYDELGKRFLALSGEPIKLAIRHTGGREPETVTLAAEGFQWSDRIVACSRLPAAGTTYNPFDLAPLSADPRFSEGDARDPFEFRSWLRQLAGKPVVVEVKRARGKDESYSVKVFVPPAYQLRLGLRMQMGKVAAVREGTAAEKVGVRGLLTSKDPADTISGVQIVDDKGNGLILGDAPKNLPENPKRIIKPLDPVRLPFDLTEFANKYPGRKLVTLTVVRPNPKQKEGVPLEPIVWDSGFDDSIESPFTWASSLSIPQLGIAYWVNSFIEAVEPGSPAANARRVIEEQPDRVWTKKPESLQAGDVITSIRFWEGVPSKPGWGDWEDLQSERGKEKAYDRWAYASEAVRASGRVVVQFKIRRDETVLAEPFEVVLQEDRSVPLTERGLALAADTHLVKAESMVEALDYGWQETWGFIKTIYKGLVRVVTGSVSTKSLEGPIGIVSRTFNLAQDDIYGLILFLGILSVNLAVVNFLPIPLLDGGHMVFLIYEKIRGKPASEQVRNIAAYIGLGLLLLLMVYVFVIDIQRRILK